MTLTILRSLNPARGIIVYFRGCCGATLSVAQGDSDDRAICIDLQQLTVMCRRYLTWTLKQHHWLLSYIEELRSLFGRAFLKQIARGWRTLSIKWISGHMISTANPDWNHVLHPHFTSSQFIFLLTSSQNLDTPECHHPNHLVLRLSASYICDGWSIAFRATRIFIDLCRRLLSIPSSSSPQNQTYRKSGQF